MGFYQLKQTQRIKGTIDEVWNFIASPDNLKKITPDYMGFDITSGDLPEKMYPGMIICYKVSPLLGIKMNWLTEITQVNEKKFFIDEQRVGPYKIWHHQHHIEPIEGGVLMTDIVTYQPPMGFLGSIANTLIIKNKLAEIFDYRKNVLNQIFGELK
ncbi:MAG: SRPBCC family protein [Gelidibacter sp.]|nr:SRPBCC family protein [Gelidibacter sp.]